MQRPSHHLHLLIIALLLWVPAHGALAFCGFYVSGADASLYNNATSVVLMRDKTRTILSMQNSYQGPPEDFAMVVPVPVILREDSVKTLSKESFQKIDRLSAPRLVEYWEQDPCRGGRVLARMTAYDRNRAKPSAAPAQMNLGVTIEAKFEVGEYNVLILSADDALGLDRWLVEHNYKIPAGASEVLKPYIASGMYFFVAKVDISKVKMEDGKATLSPLRFFYDSETFSLPVRLGLLNSAGVQDLLIYILAQGKRYEVANYPNTTIPTNLIVSPSVKQNFSSFYLSLLDDTWRQHPGSVITEYAWNSGNCDPCPGPALELEDLMTFGADALMEGGKDISFNPRSNSFSLTRLHSRYTRESLGEDLIFKEAKDITGGIGIPDPNGGLNTLIQNGDGSSMFQGRYVILHPWEGELTCSNPVRGRWGGMEEDIDTVPPLTAASLPAARADVVLADAVKAGLPDASGKTRKYELPPLKFAPEIPWYKNPQRGFSAIMALGILAMLVWAVRDAGRTSGE